MKKLPWKKILIGSLILVALVLARTAVSIGRAKYWSQDWVAVVQKDPWVYIGLAACAVAIVAWALLPGRKTQEPDVGEEE